MRIASIGIDLARPLFTWLHWESVARFCFARSSHGHNCWPIPRTCLHHSSAWRPVQERTAWEPRCESKGTKRGSFLPSS